MRSGPGDKDIPALSLSVGGQRRTYEPTYGLVVPCGAVSC